MVGNRGTKGETSEKPISSARLIDTKKKKKKRKPASNNLLSKVPNVVLLMLEPLLLSDVDLARRLVLYLQGPERRIAHVHKFFLYDPTKQPTKHASILLGFDVLGRICVVLVLPFLFVPSCQ